MDINDIFTNGLDIRDALDLLWPVSIYILGMVAYAIFVFKFYRFVAARDVFELDLDRYEGVRYKWARSILHVVLYVFKYLIVFPVFAFFWFAVLTLILAFLSKSQTFSETLLIALATVSAIRVTAYYQEDLSRDLAKILPFAVLGVFLIDASFFSVSDSFESLRQTRDHSEDILYYLLFLIALEFFLRLFLGTVNLIAYLRKRLGNRPDSTPEADPQDTTAEPQDPDSHPPETDQPTDEDPIPREDPNDTSLTDLPPPLKARD